MFGGGGGGRSLFATQYKTVRSIKGLRCRISGWAHAGAEVRSAATFLSLGVKEE